MSRFVGIINLNGSQVYPGLLGRLTKSLSFRGPDAQDVWCQANVGLGHAMLRTTFESESEHQPLSFEREVWLVADARIDGREELIDKLKTKGRNARGANDAELILHSYHACGEDCVKHLIGDFTFAIWDGRRRRLFCARDHFGIKQFYFAHTAQRLIFSNTLNCLRQHPDVSDALNEQAIGDFLICGANMEPDQTTFAEIETLPAANVLTGADGEIKKRCYWQLQADEEIRYPRAGD